MGIERLRIAHLAVAAIPAVVVAVGCRSGTPAPSPRPLPAPDTSSTRFTVGEIAAELITTIGDVVQKDGLSTALNAATVIDSAQALQALSSWKEEPTVDEARAMLAAEGSLAVLIPDVFVYVAMVDGAAQRQTIGVALDASAAEGRCPHFHKYGEEGNFWRCHCIITIQGGECPTTNTGECTACTQEAASWSPEHPWVDPIPKSFQRARELLGEDPRFACTAKADVLKPGDKLLAPCGS